MRKIKQKRGSYSFILALMVFGLTWSQNNNINDSLKRLIPKHQKICFQLSSLYISPSPYIKNNSEKLCTAIGDAIINQKTKYEYYYCPGYTAKINYQLKTRYNYSFNFGVAFLYTQSKIKYSTIEQKWIINPYQISYTAFEGYGIAEQAETSLSIFFGVNTELTKRFYITNNVCYNRTLITNNKFYAFNYLDNTSVSYDENDNTFKSYRYQFPKLSIANFVSSEHTLYYRLIKEKLSIGAGLYYCYNPKYKSTIIPQLTLNYSLCAHKKLN